MIGSVMRVALWVATTLAAGCGDCSLPSARACSLDKDLSGTAEMLAEFDQAIERVERHVTAPDYVPDELWTSGEFLRIYHAPSEYIAPAYQLLTRESPRNGADKRIAAWAMQRLGMCDYLALLSQVADRVDDGSVDGRVLEELAFAPLEFGKQVLIVKYNDPDVRAMLRRMAGMGALSESRRTYIREKVLTGAAREDYVEYLKQLDRVVEE